MVGQIWQAFEQRVRHAVDDNTIYRLLHRHGWRKVMPRPRHPKSDLNTQEQFKKTFLPRWKRQSQRKRRVMNAPSSFWPRMKAAMPRISQVKHCWAPPGMRPHVPAQLVREYVYAYAAVAPALGQMVSLVLPEASTTMMSLFLEQVSQTFPDHFIVMQVDQAGWHHSQELVIPTNIRLIPQPAYSPELDPVEHLWDELREKYFHNRIFPSLDVLIETLCQGLTDLADDPERLRSLTSFPHLNVRR